MLQLSKGLSKSRRGKMGLLGSLTAGAVIILYLVVWSICLLGLYTARKRYHQESSVHPPLSSAAPSSVPPVTIIRPLRGLDPNLYYNLESTLCLDYPRERFEVLFTVQKEDDQACDVVKMLLSKYPDVDARIIVSRADLGVNPKINNLAQPLSEAKYDILWVLDATISVTPSALARSVAALVEGEDHSSAKAGSEPLLQHGPVGLVHHVPFAWVPEKSFGSRLEQAYLASTHAKMYLAINATGIDSCVVGKSNLYRRSDLAKLQTPSATLRKLPDPPTGIAGFAPFLPEDNMIAGAIWHQLGLKHRMTSDLAMDCLGPVDVTGYIARRVRWIRVRKPMVLAATLLEPLTESLLLGGLAAWALRRSLGIMPIPFLLIHLAAWFWVDISVVKALRGEPLRGQELVEFAQAWAVREMLTLPIWIWAMMGSIVVWRGTRYRISRTGEAIRL